MKFKHEITLYLSTSNNSFENPREESIANTDIFLSTTTASATEFLGKIKIDHNFFPFIDNERSLNGVGCVNPDPDRQGGGLN